ncbi:Adenylate cyclase type 10 [Orchesella cincta]|uniref:Adenylate cyclase type 10 n=1 Tax=Orchesella cincta TaxID=48709 RepID=A0A1D2NDV7_ORCCI|nr:Adenylate cyclase type 10 [Orchesella cincta]
MVYYPGRLTCDQDTAYFSKLPLENFKLMEAKELKGIKDVGKIYEFVNADSSDDNSIPFFQYPMLGRENELTYFKTALQRTKKELGNISAQHNMGGTFLNRALGVGAPDLSGNNKNVWMIIFEGDNGVGKSRMLGACIHEAEKLNIRVFTVGMTLASSSQAHFAISCLVIEALGMLELRTVPEREEYLRKHVTDSDLAADLCLLNEILHTKFPLNPKYTAMDVNTCAAIAQHVLASLLRVTYPEDLILFVVDDAHLMDPRSWEYLVYVSKSPNVFGLFSLRRSNAGSPKLQDSVTKQIYHNKNIKIIRIGGLPPNLLLPLACQIMHVKAIPQDLEKLITNKSNGVGAWIDQVLKELIRTQIIRFEKDGYNKMPMAVVDKKYLEKMTKVPKKSFRRWAQEDNDDNIRYANAGNDAFSVGAADANAKEEIINPLERVLVIKSDTNIHSVPVSGTLKEILLDAYDELNPNEQIILKAATVLGVRFSRQMLTRLLPSYEMWARKYDQGFNSLLEAKYFRCASGTAKQKEASSAINAKPECFCRDDEFTAFIGAMEGGQSVEKRPKYYSCRFMEFMKENMVEVVYDVMTEDQRAEFHLKAAKYLDSSIIRCESCGGEDRSYLFGFVRKINDYSVDNEGGLRLSGQARRKSSQKGGGDLGLSNIPHQGKHHATIETQLEGLRKTFEQSGTKVGNIELDIMRTLMDFDKNENRTTGCCCCRRAKAKEIAEEEAVINRFEEQELVEHPPSGAEREGTTHRSLTSSHLPPDVEPRHSRRTSQVANGIPIHMHHSIDHHQLSEGQTQNQTPLISFVDLRTCQCAVLQAKICVEMVFHYREAKKYGRCLQNLLDAAESDVTVGNGTQALVHIEDALGLLTRVKDGDLPAPDRDDQDDATIDEKEAESQIEFLSGLAYFEIGVNTKAREYFLKALHRLGLKIHYDESGVRRDAAILGAKMRLWRTHHCSCCYRKRNANNENDDTWQKKIRILSYLHSLFKNEKKIEMALLVTIWQVIIAEQYGEIVHDIIPAYANMMGIYSALSKHRDAKRYEHFALEMIRSSVGSDSQIEPLGLITSANLFLSVAIIRLSRGEIESSSSAAYLALRIAQTIHDNALTIRVLPLLCQTLLLSLRITEIAEALQKLWFLAEESDDWTGVSNYYAICLDLLLNTAYPLEHFGVCENFITNSDWTAETNMFRDVETQYSMECSLALWYSRYSRWEQSQKWLTEAEAHKPKYHSFSTVNSDLKLLECQLIFVNHYLDSKRYQHFAKARNAAKELMRTLTKATEVVPVLKPRFTHLMAYYYRVRSRNVEAEKQLKAAEKLAEKMGNNLEQEWLIHSRTVWADLAIPTIKYFWLEHTEAHTLDWHSSGKIPWANIMYSLPLPAWK